MFTEWPSKENQWLNFKNPELSDGFCGKDLWTQFEVRASLVAQMVKCLSTMRETWVRFLGWEKTLEKEMAIHSSTITWKIPWTEEPGRLQSMGSQRVGHD